MRLVAVAAWAVAALALAPAARGATLMEELTNAHFGLVTLTVNWNRVDVAGADWPIPGEAASELRKCMDNKDCPDSNLASLGSAGNGDGQVTKDEVAEFAEALNDLIGLAPQAKDFRERLSQFIKLDDKRPNRILFDGFVFRNAEGPVASTQTIFLSVKAHGEFDGIGEMDAHKVEIQRTTSQLNMTDRIVIKTARGWSIDASTIAPADMAKYYADGRLSGTQDEFESPQPMTFLIQEKSVAGGWVVALSVAGLLAGAGLLLFAFARRRRRGRKA